MWMRVEGGTDRPREVDDTSSMAYVYVRRNIEQVAATEERGAHWCWDELSVPRDSFEAWEQADTNADAIADLAEVAAENEVSVSDLGDAFAEYVEYNESKE